MCLRCGADAPFERLVVLMGSFHLAGMSLRNFFRKPATKMYPVVAPAYTSRTKGQVVIDIETCILCGICAKKCPSLAIRVDKPARTWSIDPFACIQCNSCVRDCPKDSLRMAPEKPTVGTVMSILTVNKPEQEPEPKDAGTKPSKAAKNTGATATA
jgi:formate hydrogenlyase subunit 6/NADH:ubiquinone oxidoreductase subunit I